MLRRTLQRLTLLSALLYLAVARVAVAEPLVEARAPEELGTASRVLALRQQLADQLRTSAFRKVRVGVSILNTQDGSELYSQNADAPFNPASNAKILTTAAALATLGSDFRYRTVLLAPKPEGGSFAPDGVLRGDVFLQGSGDPTLRPEGLTALVRQLRNAGIERIEGQVRLDSQLRDLGALTVEARPGSHGPGALLLNRDRISVHVSPTSVGQRASAWVQPRSPYFVVHSLAKTVKGKRSRLSIDVAKRDGLFVVTLRGRIGSRSGTVKVRRRLGGSTAWAEVTLQQALADFGIAVTGGVHVGEPPVGPLAVVAEHKSEPLSKICHTVNKDSDNYIADIVFKTLGAARFGLPGTLEKGARAVSEWVAEQGLLPERVHLINGSGLTHSNRLRPGDLGLLLNRLYHQMDVGPEFLQSLAVGGIDGTIHHRFHGSSVGQVRAKTGTLFGVSVLSGIFVQGFRGRRLESIRHAQARIVETLLRYVRDGRPGEVIPKPASPAGLPDKLGPEPVPAEPPPFEGEDDEA
jgi:serine-type D-Ala-D-Ala carboxypeptidase/endopeptidase (penicillin-binding protein 4)